MLCRTCFQRVSCAADEELTFESWQFVAIVSLAMAVSLFAYRLMEVKYWSRKSLACSSTKSDLRASTAALPMFMMLLVQVALEQDNIWQENDK